MADPKNCRGITRDGTSCLIEVLDEDHYCGFHRDQDPRIKVELERARRELIQQELRALEGKLQKIGWKYFLIALPVLSSILGFLAYTSKITLRATAKEWAHEYVQNEFKWRQSETDSRREAIDEAYKMAMGTTAHVELLKKELFALRRSAKDEKSKLESELETARGKLTKLDGLGAQSEERIKRLEILSNRVSRKSDAAVKLAESANKRSQGVLAEAEKTAEKAERVSKRAEKSSSSLDTIESTFDEAVSRLKKDPSFRQGLSLPVGTVAAFSGPVAKIPGGWQPCDGRPLKASAYPDLAAVIGTIYGGTSGTTIKLPDYRGYFLRGADGGTGRDPEASQRAGGSNVGSTQGDSTGPHEHSVNVSQASVSGSTTGSDQRNVYASVAKVKTNTTLWSGTETRPKNIYVHWIIKVKP